jgi:hypothetical protein
MHRAIRKRERSYRSWTLGKVGREGYMSTTAVLAITDAATTRPILQTLQTTYRRNLLSLHS